MWVPTSITSSVGSSMAHGPLSLLPRTARTGATARSASNTAGAPMSPQWTMRSDPRSRSTASGRIRPWVSEITPTTCRPDLSPRTFDVPMPLGPLGRPLPCATRERLAVGRPVVQCGGVEVRAVRPDQGVHLGIYAHLAKDRRIAQRAVQCSGEHRFEVDSLRSAVIELDTECMRPNDFDTMHAMDGMAHAFSYLRGSIGCGGRPRCNSSQSAISSA